MTYIFLILLAIASVYALTDWRRGWYVAILIGVLQDPFRKLTPGAPVLMNLSIVVVYAAAFFGGRQYIKPAFADFKRQYPQITTAYLVFFALLLIAGLTGLMTFGLNAWRAPALGLFVYCLPVPAIIFGYTFLQQEEQLYRFMRFYAIITSIALIGVPFEYFRAGWRILGTVSLGNEWIRHLPGIQVRILSGTYRSPDIMGWHAATLGMIALIFIIRRGFPQGWLWMTVAAWGFMNVMLSGRRKAIYMLAVFAAVFLWRYLKSMHVMHVISLMAVAVIVWVIFSQLSSGSDESRSYVQGTATSRTEVFGRLEGGLIETFRQFGIMGAGLGAATQGVQHLLPPDQALGWQEGGAGKLAVELGLPGLLGAIVLVLLMMRTLFLLSFQRDQFGALYLVRVALFAMVVANAFSFLASAQPYSDAVLALMTAFLAGCLFATTRLPAISPPHPGSVPRYIPVPRPSTA